MAEALALGSNRRRTFGRVDYELGHDYPGV